MIRIIRNKIIVKESRSVTIVQVWGLEVSDRNYWECWGWDLARVVEAQALQCKFALRLSYCIGVSQSLCDPIGVTV